MIWEATAPQPAVATLEGIRPGTSCSQDPAAQPGPESPGRINGSSVRVPSLHVNASVMPSVAAEGEMPRLPVEALSSEPKGRGFAPSIRPLVRAAASRLRHAQAISEHCTASDHSSRGPLAQFGRHTVSPEW